LGKLLILLGVLLIGIGMMITFKVSIPFLGRLPGDILLSGEKGTFYFPITTCLLLSLFLSVLFYIFSKF
jgi:hypothetical protein